MLTVDLDRLGVRRGAWLLDAGCGAGRHCFGAFDRGLNVVGLDLDQEALRLAQQGLATRLLDSDGPAPAAKPLRNRDETRGAGVLRGDVFRLPFCDGRFDHVICSEVMEHVHAYEKAIRELVRVLRPGGTIAITIPTATTEHLYLHLTREYFESPGGHIRIFQPRQLARAMGRSGLRVEGVGFAHALHSPYWAVRSLIGLHDETPGPTRAYRLLLMKASLSRFWTKVEHCFDWIWPKSLILYGRRVATGLD